MPRLKFAPAEAETYLAQLEDTPRRISACAAGLTEDQLRWTASKGDWSAMDILAHLRACQNLWAHSIYLMLTEVNPILPRLDPRRWVKTVGYTTREFHKSFQAYCLEREELLAVLRALPEDLWSRAGVIEGQRSEERRVGK